jgi:hypothetical protein
VEEMGLIRCGGVTERCDLGNLEPGMLDAFVLRGANRGWKAGNFDEPQPTTEKEGSVFTTRARLNRPVLLSLFLIFLPTCLLF